MESPEALPWEVRAMEYLPLNDQVSQGCHVLTLLG